MTDITSYSCGNTFYYGYNKLNPDYIDPCASGTSGSADVSGTSGLSETSGTSYKNTYSKYITESIGTVENLSLEQVIDLFTHGNLTVGEMDKWLTFYTQYGPKKYINHWEKSESNGMIKYEFQDVHGRNYIICCNAKAAESQTDAKKQTTYLLKNLQALADSFNLTLDQVKEYFQLAYFDEGRYENRYIIKPNCGSWYQLQQHLKELNDFQKKVDSGEYDNYSEDTINNYLELMKKDLKMKYGYSDEYVDFIMEYVKTNSIESIRPNAKPTHKTVKECLNKLMNALLDKNAISINNIFNTMLSDNNNPDPIEMKFIQFVMRKKFGEKHLNESEKKLFIKILKQKIENSGNLDKNWDGSKIDELMEIAFKEFDKIKHIEESEVDNAKTINVNELFQGQKTLNAEYILSHLNEMKLSNDPGVRKIAQIIQNGLYEVMTLTDYDIYKFDMDEANKKWVKSFIAILNDKLGIQNSRVPALNIGDLSGDISFNIIESADFMEKVNRAYQVNVDGKVDKFSQGHTGDCWIMSGIKSLTSTQAGRDLFSNAISWSNDYSEVTVYFAGIDRYITLKAEDIIEFDKLKKDGIHRYADGDNDILIIEMAMKQLHGNWFAKSWFGYEDIEFNYASTFWEDFVGGADIDSDSASSFEYAWKGLWGGTVDMDTDDVKDMLQKIYNAKKKYGTGFAASFLLMDGAIEGLTGYGRDYYCKTTDGVTHKIGNITAHVLAITDITQLTVTFVNPHNPSEEFTCYWDDFAAIGIANIELCTYPDKYSHKEAQDNEFCINGEVYNIGVIRNPKYHSEYNIPLDSNKDEAKRRLKIMMQSIMSHLTGHNMAKVKQVGDYITQIYSNYIDQLPADNNGIKYIDGRINIDAQKMLNEFFELLEK